MSEPKIVPYRHLQFAETLITENEALTLTPYRCQSGKLTIGYGRNIEARGIEYNEAELMLANDIQEANHALELEFGFYGDLSDARKAVLMDMYHNLGFEGLLEFQQMIKGLMLEDYNKAADEIKDSRYWIQVPSRARRNFYMMKFDRYVSIQTAKSYFISQ